MKIVKRTDGKAEYNNEECEKDPEKKTKDHSGISGHGLICFRSGMVSDEEGTCLSII